MKNTVFHTSTGRKKVRIDVTFEKISVDYATLRCTETFRCTFACPISACQRRKHPDDERVHFIFVDHFVDQ